MSARTAKLVGQKKSETVPVTKVHLRDLPRRLEGQLCSLRLLLSVRSRGAHNRAYKE